MTRCKIGDIARIKDGPNQDRIVTVESPSLKYEPHFWFVESMGSPLLGDNGETGRWGHIEDSRLEPIRDEPGTDQTLRRLEVVTS